MRELAKRAGYDIDGAEDDEDESGDQDPKVDSDVDDIDF